MRRKPKHPILRRLLLLLLVITGVENGFGQTHADTGFINVSRINTFEPITRKSDILFLAPGVAVDAGFSSPDFHPAASIKNEIPSRLVNHRLMLRFRIVNPGDSPDSLWFFPGLFYSQIHLYRAIGNSIIPLPDVEPSIDDSIGYRLLSITPHDTIMVLAVMTPVKTYTNYIRPSLINKFHLQTFFAALSAPHYYVNIITYIFCGLLLMMILFSLASFIGVGNREFLYYAGYAIFLGGMLFTKTYYDNRISEGVFFLEAYLDFILQSIGIGFYMVFMKGFLSTRTNYPFLDRLYNAGIAGVLISLVLFTYSYFFTGNFIFLNDVENITKLVLLVMMVVFLVYCLRIWKDKLLRYLFWGNLFYFFFAVFSQLLIFFGHFLTHLPSVFNSALFYYQLGLFLELVLFLAGLSYKNRRQIIEQTKEREQLKMENERKEFEKQMAVITAQQEERNRISSDMHDELGSGMTHIRLMSEIAKNKMKQDTPLEIEKISQSADDVLNKMNAIIWSMNSENDSLDNLVSYIRAYAIEYLEGTPVDCQVNVPEFIPELQLSGDKRRNVFLCVKETLNNMLKHSNARKLHIDITADGALIIRIADNGIGIDLQHIRRFGNGLQNIERRMKNIGGSFEIRSNHGTETLLVLPL